MHLQLPKRPVDGYTVHGWGVYSHNSYTVRKLTFVYHKNTKWDDYDKSGDNRGGADLVDDWMVYEGDIDGESWDYCRGRYCGWTSLEDAINAPQSYEPMFDTQMQAIKYLRAMAALEMWRHRREYRRFEALVADLEGQDA
jgi:hypothetical protein